MISLHINPPNKFLIIYNSVSATFTLTQLIHSILNLFTSLRIESQPNFCYSHSNISGNYPKLKSITVISNRNDSEIQDFQQLVHVFS